MFSFSCSLQTHPDEMIGASRQKQNYAMHRQLSDFERYIQRADNLFSIERLYRELKCIVPQGQTVNSLQALRQVVQRVPRSTHRRISNIFFKTFFEYVNYLRRLSRVFKERIHTVLFDFFYDTMFIRLQDIDSKSNGAKKGRSLKKGPAQDLSPEKASEVSELCQQLCCTVDGIEETISSWGKLLEETEIDSALFDTSSEHCVCHFKDCKRFQGVLRLVPDVLNKSRMAVIFARAWWYKAEKIRRKLGQKSECCSDWSSPDTDFPSVPKTVQKTNKRQKEKTDSKDQPMTHPTVFRRRIKKVKSLEELDAERKELIKPRRGPVRKPANPDGHSEKVLTKPECSNQGAKQQDEQPENGKSVHKKTLRKKQSKFPPYQAKHDRNRMHQKKQATDPDSKPGESAGPGTDEEPNSQMSRQPRKARPRDQNSKKTTQSNQIKPSSPTLNDHCDDGRNKTSPMLGDEQSDETQMNQTSDRNPNKKQKQKQNQNRGGTTMEDNKNIRPKPLVAHNRGNKKGSNELHGHKQHPEENIPTKKTHKSKDALKQLPAENISTKKTNKPKDSSRTRKANQQRANKNELDGEQSDVDNLTWPEQKVEKLRQRFDETIECKEIQQAAFKLMDGQKENLVRDIEKYQGYYRHNRILKARVILLIGKVREWKEEKELLDYQCRLLKEDLELEMQLDASLIR